MRTAAESVLQKGKQDRSLPTKRKSMFILTPPYLADLTGLVRHWLGIPATSVLVERALTVASERMALGKVSASKLFTNVFLNVFGRYSCSKTLLGTRPRLARTHTHTHTREHTHANTHVRTLAHKQPVASRIAQW